MSEMTVAVRPKTDVGDQSVDSPGYVSGRCIEQHDSARIVRDVYKGTAHMRLQGRRYMPQWGPLESGGYTESDRAYADRLSNAKLFNGTRKTVKGLTGMAFRKPIQLSEIPSQIEPHLENIDLAGRDLTTFARDGFDDKLQAGHGVILVDWHDPEKVTNAAGVRTRRDEEDARPYWAWIAKEQILRFRTRSVKGKVVLERFAYEEADTVEEGEFGEKEIMRVHEYRLVRSSGGKDLPGERVEHRSWTRDADSEGEWAPEDVGTLLGERMTEIPVRADYAGRRAYLISDPPLKDLAEENVAHWQLRSDRDHSLHVGCVPIWVVRGMSKEELTENVLNMGTSIGLALPKAEADAGWRETQGSAYSASRDELQDIEQRMAALGLSILVRKSQVQRTAEENRNERTEHDSELAAFVDATNMAMTGALELHAKWMGLDAGGSATLPTDFDPHPIDAQTLAVLVKGVGTVISRETLWDMMQSGEILPDNFDPELEAQRLAGAGEDELSATLREILMQRQNGGGNGGGQQGGEDGEGDNDNGEGGEDE